MSLGYSKYGRGPKSARALHPQGVVTPTVFGAGEFVVIALCEVVASPTLNKTHRNDTIWVQSNHDHVVTRMLFVLENGRLGPGSGGTGRWPMSTDAAFRESIRGAIGH